MVFPNRMSIEGEEIKCFVLHKKSSQVRQSSMSGLPHMLRTPQY